MDFESGIDTWVIDKEDSNGSCYTLNKPESSFTPVNTKKTMDKENITRASSTTEKNSLRSFRIRKDISYRELSSESESESNKSFFPEDDSFCLSKKQQNKLSSSYCDKKLSNASNKNISLTSLSDLHCITKEKESLSSEEINLYLSDRSSSSDGNQEKFREHLHSIENVASMSESKVGDESISPTPLKLHCNVLRSSSEFNCTEELKSYENVTNTTSSIYNSNQHSQGQNLKNDTFPFSSGSLKSKPAFLDSYKTHLTNQRTNNENKSKRVSGLFDSSVVREKSDKYSRCNQQLFKCNSCSYCCSDLLLHKSHLILFHSEKKILDCEYCDYQTSQCANLATHIRVHFKLDCPYCDYQCPLKKSLESHLLASHGVKTHYKCKRCDFICKSQIKFKKHSQKHLALGKYKCSDCNLGFKNKETLKAHVKKHLTKEKAFKCFSCHMSFCKKQQLKIHMRSHEQSFVCNICHFKCTYKQKLEIHMKIHKRRSLKCGKCSLLFTKKSNLKLHMRDHFPNSKCQYCPFQSSDSIELSKHICIRKLYNVQKRTLNFENSNDEVNFKRYEVKSNLNSTVVQCTKRVKEPVEEANNRHGLAKSAHKRKRQKPNNHRLLSLRSHLRSRIVEKSKNANKGEMVSKSRQEEKSHEKFNKQEQLSDKIKHTYQIGLVSPKENIEFRQRIKQDQLRSLGLNCTKGFYNNKFTPKEILLEPARLTNGSFIQCYYQSQPSINTPNHMERHIRQSTLISCRFCNYKTNSSRLLQRHTAKNHTWDPAVVSILFS